MIAIKDFKMPENCLKCPMQFGGWCYVSPPEVDERVAPTVDEAWEQGKPDWCPLIDVPEMNVGNISEFSNSSTDCISRQAAIDAITVRADRCAEIFSTDDPFWEGLVIAKSIVKGLPPVQAATSVQPERKKGKWIYYEQRESRYDIEGVKTYAAVYRCSECGFLHIVIEDFGRYKFCQNCGSDNRGEQG